MLNPRQMVNNFSFVQREREPFPNAMSLNSIFHFIISTTKNVANTNQNNRKTGIYMYEWYISEAASNQEKMSRDFDPETLF